MLVQRPRMIPDRIAPAAAAAASPLERNTRSPQGWRKRESDRIGLAILAALEKPLPVRDAAPASLVSLHASAPIAIASPRVAMAAARIEGSGPEACCNSGALWASPQGRIGAIPTADFLSRCYLCRKRLHGKDIYMYRGDKAFCSAECRHQQIVADDDARFHVSKQSDAAAAAAAASSHGRLFFTAGIIAN